MAAEITILTHKIAMQLHPVAESSTICCSRSRRPVRKLLDTPSYTKLMKEDAFCLLPLAGILDFHVFNVIRSSCIIA
jgi:hypothetical protein